VTGLHIVSEKPRVKSSLGSSLFGKANINFGDNSISFRIIAAGSQHSPFLRAVDFFRRILLLINEL
jgi:hypothetical protein